MRSTVLFPGLMLLVAASFFAQEAPQDVQDPTQFEAKPAQLPKGNNVWSVRMVRSGGFTGLTQTATLTSDGKLACSCANRNVSKDLSRADLLALVTSADLKTSLVGNATVKAVKPGEKVALGPPTLCRDCLVTRMTVQHRDSSGNVETYFVSWDDVTASGAPVELVKIAKSIASLLQ